MNNLRISAALNTNSNKTAAGKSRIAFKESPNSIRVQILEKEELRLRRLAGGLQCCGLTKKMFANWIENVCTELQDVKGSILDELREKSTF